MRDVQYEVMHAICGSGPLLNIATSGIHRIFIHKKGIPTIKSTNSVLQAFLTHKKSSCPFKLLLEQVGSIEML
jgi:hypothetical protein